MANKLNLVLTGGGARSAFQTGVLKRLNENEKLKKRITKIYASSGGVINGIMFIAGHIDKFITDYYEKYDSGEKEWVTNYTFFIDGIFKYNSLFSVKNAFKIIDEMELEIKKVLSSKIEFLFTVSNFETGLPELISNHSSLSFEEYKEFIRASISGNIAFPIYIINKTPYGDGEILSHYNIFTSSQEKKTDTIVISNYNINSKQPIRKKFFEEFNFIDSLKTIIIGILSKDLKFELMLANRHKPKDNKLAIVFPEEFSEVASLSPFKIDYKGYKKIIDYGYEIGKHHYAYPNDYKNKTKWYHHDPSKWIIKLLNLF